MSTKQFLKYVLVAVVSAVVATINFYLNEDFSCPSEILVEPEGKRVAAPNPQIILM